MSETLRYIDCNDEQNWIYVSTTDSNGELVFIDERTTKILTTDFRVVEQIEEIVDCYLDVIQVSVIDTKFEVLETTEKIMECDFRVLADSYDDLTDSPYARDDFHVYIDDVEQDDVVLDSISVIKNVDGDDSASFTLVRNHDNPDVDLDNNTRQITNKNEVEVKIGTTSIFTGYINKLSMVFSNREEIRVEALDRKTSYLTLSDLAMGNTYSVRGSETVLGRAYASNPNAYTTKLLTSSTGGFTSDMEGLFIEIASGTNFEAGTYKIKEVIDSNTVVLDDNATKGTGDSASSGYGRVWGKLNYGSPKKTINLPLPTLNTQLHIYDVISLTGLEIENPTLNNNAVDLPYYNGVKVDLGRNEYERHYGSGMGTYTTSPFNLDIVVGYDANNDKIPDTISHLAIDGLAAAINAGTLSLKQDYSYFWTIRTTNLVTGQVKSGYIGTSLGGVTGSQWYLTHAHAHKQKIVSNDSYSLGYYTVGSAPFKEISTTNGKYSPLWVYQDDGDGLYKKINAGYDYVEYAKKIADVEYDKMKTTTGSLFPKTSANIEVSVDAYLFYAVELLNRINIVNTISLVRHNYYWKEL